MYYPDETMISRGTAAAMHARATATSPALSTSQVQGVGFSV